MNAPTPTQPPQGVMAELRELLAAHKAAYAAWVASRETLGPEWREYENARARLHAASDVALPDLLNYVDALRVERERLTAEVRGLQQSFADEVALNKRTEAACVDAESRASALLARCEGLEAALNDVRRAVSDDAYAATFQTLGQYRNALLAATQENAP